jgi:phage gp16-like protein
MEPNRACPHDTHSVIISSREIESDEEQEYEKGKAATHKLGFREVEVDPNNDQRIAAVYTMLL